MKITRYIKKKDQQKKEPPQIIIYKDAYTKLCNYTRAKKIEIMLLGVIEQKGNTYFITDFVIPPQTDNTGAFVTTDDEPYAKWLQEMPREERQKLRLHYHTHPGMSTTPSSTDQETIRDKVENISDFYIRMIGNQDLQFHIDFFDLKNEMLYEEMNMYLFLNDYTIVLGKKDAKIVQPEYKNAEKELDEKITKKYTHPTYPTYPYRNKSYGMYGHSIPEPVTTIKKELETITKEKKTIPKEEKIEEVIEKYQQLLFDIETIIYIVPDVSNKEVLKHLGEDLVDDLNFKHHEDLLKTFDLLPLEWEQLDLSNMVEYFQYYVEILEDSL